MSGGDRFVRRLVWLHHALDPLQSGELRRLGMPALALRERGYVSELAWAPAAAAYRNADLAVVPWQALAHLPLLAGSGGPKIVVEVDDSAACAEPETLAPLLAVAGRAELIVARSEAVARRLLSERPDLRALRIIGDPAVLPRELPADTRRLGSGDRASSWPREGGRLWFAEPGDLVADAEVQALARSKDAGDLLILAPAEVMSWIDQMNVAGRRCAWSPSALENALAHADDVIFFGPRTAGQLRRLTVARRAGACIRQVAPEAVERLTPEAVAAAWQDALGEVLRPTAAAPSSGILLFLDLMQDLDLALPMIDELQATPGMNLRVAASTWLLDRSPRVRAELEARTITIEAVEREDVLAGRTPDLATADTLVTIAETDHRGHARSHALTLRAKREGIPTISLQHGLENDGVHPSYGESGMARIASDHFLAWFPPDEIPATAPADLRPRLVHIGRVATPPAAPTDLPELRGAHELVLLVCENLHWVRYTDAYRTRFLEDCVECAILTPDVRVVLKPHHGGLWSVRNRALIEDWPPNLALADPTDPRWEPFTAPSLMAAADLVVTTPSTVALDAAQARKPVAVASYGLDLADYRPLPMLNGLADWVRFMRQDRPAATARAAAAFLRRSAPYNDAAPQAAAYVAQVAARRAAAERPRPGAVTEPLEAQHEA